MKLEILGAATFSLWFLIGFAICVTVWASFGDRVRQVRCYSVQNLNAGVEAPPRERQNQTNTSVPTITEVEFLDSAR